MLRRVGMAAVVIALSLALGTLEASAHASLVRCSIHNRQVLRAGHTPGTIQAFFAENLDPSPGKSWINVFEGTGDHGLVNEKTRSVVNFRNPREVTLKIPRLHKGSYYIIWYTHSAEDGHFAAGIVYFTVK